MELWGCICVSSVKLSHLPVVRISHFCFSVGKFGCVGRSSGNARPLQDKTCSAMVSGP